MILNKLKAKLEQKDTVHAPDQNEIDKFCSDFKHAVKKYVRIYSSALVTKARVL